MQKYEGFGLSNHSRIALLLLGVIIVSVWWMANNTDWDGGNRAFFDPGNPLKDVCPKCGGWGYTVADGMPKPCKECESKGFIVLASILTAITVAGFKKIMSKR